MSCDKVLEPETQIRDGVVMVTQFSGLLTNLNNMKSYYYYYYY